MERAGYGVAASIGAAVGFGALGWLAGSVFFLVVGALLSGVGATPSAQAVGWRAALWTFFGQPLKLWHAVVWCASLITAMIFVAAFAHA